MPEKKRNIVPLSGQVRLPEILDRAIDMESSRLGVFKYEVIEAAWKTYKDRDAHKEGDRDNGTQLPSTTVAPEVEFSPTGLPRPLSDLESICIERLLRILRSPKPGLPDAIISNLMQFEDADVMYERIHHADQAGESGTLPAGEQERVGDVDAEIAGLQRTARDIADRIQRIKADGNAPRKRKTDNPRASRKRSGA